MIVFKVKLKDGSYLGINHDAVESKEMFFKTTKEKAHKYFTQNNAETGAKLARYKQYLAEEAYWAVVEKDCI